MRDEVNVLGTVMDYVHVRGEHTAITLARRASRARFHIRSINSRAARVST
jgi:hypothetical protein